MYGQAPHTSKSVHPPAPVSLVLLELDPAKLIQLKIIQMCPLSGIQIECIKRDTRLKYFVDNHFGVP